MRDVSGVFGMAACLVVAMIPDDVEVIFRREPLRHAAHEIIYLEIFCLVFWPSNAVLMGHLVRPYYMNKKRVYTRIGHPFIGLPVGVAVPLKQRDVQILVVQRIDKRAGIKPIDRVI